MAVVAELVGSLCGSNYFWFTPTFHSLFQSVSKDQKTDGALMPAAERDTDRRLHLPWLGTALSANVGRCDKFVVAIRAVIIPSARSLASFICNLQECDYSEPHLHFHSWLLFNMISTRAVCSSRIAIDFFWLLRILKFIFEWFLMISLYIKICSLFSFGTTLWKCQILNLKETFIIFPIKRMQIRHHHLK